MTFEELVKSESKINRYIQTDNKNLHWFVETSLTDWAQQDKAQWGTPIKGDKNVVVYKIFDGNNDNKFDTFLAVQNKEQNPLHYCKDYEGMAAWIDMYLISKNF